MMMYQFSRVILIRTPPLDVMNSTKERRTVIYQMKASQDNSKKRYSLTFNLLEVLFCICTLITHVYVSFEVSIHLTIHVVYV